MVGPRSGATGLRWRVGAALRRNWWLAFRSRARWDTPVLVGLAVLVCASLVASLPVFAQLPPAASDDLADLLGLYFDGAPPPRYHIRLSGAEHQFIERTGESLTAEVCWAEFLLDDLWFG